MTLSSKKYQNPRDCGSIIYMYIYIYIYIFNGLLGIYVNRNTWWHGLSLDG